ncbi:MAG: hypothetical protein ABR542_09625, partial [Desulfonatronovibrio sp.]
MNKSQDFSTCLNFAGCVNISSRMASIVLTTIFLLAALWPQNLHGRSEGHVPADAELHVLLLNSYHKGLSWTDALTESVFETLSPLGFEISVEYMDTKRHPLVQSEDYLLSFFSAKLDGVNFDAVIVSDNDALNFARQHRAVL